MGLTLLLRKTLIDKYAVHFDAYTWYRHSLIEPFLISGPIRSLNIGTGGGVETLRLLRRGNYVTTVEIDEGTAKRTRDRVARNGYADKHTGVVGHVLEVCVSGRFDEILMLEVSRFAGS